MVGAQPRRSPVETFRPASMLVVDFDSDLHQLLKNVTERFKLRLTLCETSARGFRPGVVAFSPDVVLVNLAASRICLELLPDIRRLWPDARVIFVSEWDDMHLYAEAIQLGAYDFLPRPAGIDELGIILQRAVQHPQTRTENRSLSFVGI